MKWSGDNWHIGRKKYFNGLLREKKYTIEGAKKILDDQVQDKQLPVEKKDKKGAAVDLVEMVDEKDKRSIKEDLEEVKSFLKLLLTKL